MFVHLPRLARLLLTASLVIGPAAPALAQYAPERTPIAGTWGPNAAVSDSVVVGNTLFLGGSFDYVGPPTGAFAMADMSDGQTVQTAPAVLGESAGAASDGAGGWFVARRQYSPPGNASITHVRADGSLDPAFAPPSFARAYGTAYVYGLVRAGGRLYVFGDFETANGVPRAGIAALDTATGALLSWNAQLAGPGGNSISPYVFRAVVDGNSLYLAGYFTSIGGQPRQGFAALDADTGVLRPFTFDSIQGSSVSELAAAGGRVYASGGCAPTGPTYRLVCAYGSDGTELPNWGGVSGEYFGQLAATPTRVYIMSTQFLPGLGNVDIRIRGFDPVTGAPDGWQSPRFRGTEPGGYASISTITVGGSQVFVSGTFATVGGVRRTRFAAVDTSTGALTPWQPAVSMEAKSLASDGTRVAILGAFTSAGGRYTPNIAALDLRTGLPAPMPLPVISATVRAFAVSGSLVVAGAGEEIVAFSATTGVERTRFTISAPGKPPGTVYALAIAEPLLFVGGNFVDVLGQPRRHLAAIDMRTGQPTAFDPQPDNQVYRLRVSSGAVYAVGAFATVPGYARGGVAAWNVTTGVLETFSPAPWSVSDMAFFRDRVLLAGIIRHSAEGTTWVGRAAGEPLALGRPVPFIAHGVARTGDTIIVGGEPSPGWSAAGLVAMDAASGAPLPWAPVVSGLYGGTIQHIDATADTVVITGSFNAVEGVPVYNLAIFRMPGAATPRRMTASVVNNTATIRWQAGSGPAAASYTLEVGTASGASDIGTFNVGAATQVAGALPAGTYYTRVRGVGVSGPGAAGSEVILTVPATSSAPATPGTLTASVAGGVVSLNWGAAAGNATQYVVEAGTQSGLANIGMLPTGSLDTMFATPAPPGTYFVRVRAVNAAGASGATNDVMVVVP